MLTPKQNSLVILSEGCFGNKSSKTATGVIRYGEWPTLGVIDSTQANKKVRDVTDIDSDIPIVATLTELLPQKPAALLMGMAPAGGYLTDELRPIILEAIQNGLHIVNGLHDFFERDSEFSAAAKKSGSILWDVRNPDLVSDQWHGIAEYPPRETIFPRVITMVGSDCSVGKMCTALELQRGMKNSAFVATGQTGIMITGRGVPIDCVVGDYMAGYLESEIEIIARQNPQAQYLFVEGQGSLAHPAYSGVTLGLLHGSKPDALILCHKADIDSIRGPYDIPIPDFKTLINRYEEAASWTQPKRKEKIHVLGLSINTQTLSEADAKTYIETLAKETGLPATDPIRFGVDNLASAIEKAFTP